MNIGKAIKEIREEKGISQEKLSIESGVGRSHLYRIEHNKISPTVASLDKIAGALGVKVSDIIKKAE